MESLSHSLFFLLITWTWTWSLHGFPGSDAKDAEIKCVWETDAEPKVSRPLDQKTSGVFSKTGFIASATTCYIKPSHDPKLETNKEYRFIAYSITREEYNRFLRTCYTQPQKPANVKDTTLVAYVYGVDFMIALTENRGVAGCIVWLGFKNGEEDAYLVCSERRGEVGSDNCWAQYETSNDYQMVYGFWKNIYGVRSVFAVPEATFKFAHDKCRSHHKPDTMVFASIQYYCFWNMDTDTKSPCVLSPRAPSRKKTFRLQNASVVNPPKKPSRKLTGKQLQTQQLYGKNQKATNRPSNAVAGRSSNAIARRPSNAVAGRSSNAVAGRSSNAVAGRPSNAVAGRPFNANSRPSNAIAGRPPNAVAGRPPRAIAGHRRVKREPYC